MSAETLILPFRLSLSPIWLVVLPANQERIYRVIIRQLKCPAAGCRGIDKPAKAGI